MSKWTKTRRDPGRTYQDEGEVRRLREAARRVRELVGEAADGNPDAEPEYVKTINGLEPGMKKERRKELIKQFRDAVADAQQRGGPHHR